MNQTDNFLTVDEYLEKNSGTVCLCGSTRFFFEAIEANRRLTFNNWIVLQCGSWGHAFHKYVESSGINYETVKKLHFYKILKSDLIVVVSDKTQYMGDSTKKELEFARYLKLPIIYFNGDKFFGELINSPMINSNVNNLTIDSFIKENGYI